MRLNLFSKLAISSIILITLALLLPLTEIKNVDAILASATFLYGIFYGFEVAVVLQNFSQLKSLLAVENAGLLAIYQLSKTINNDMSEKVGEKIDQYLMKAIEFPLTTYVQNTSEEFFAIFKPFENVKLSKDSESAALNYAYEGMYYLPQTRNQISQVAPRDVDPPEWGLLIILALIIITSLFLGREADIFSRISAAIFSMSVIGSLLLLDEIDSNRIQEEHLECEIFNRTLDAIGKMRYYPEFLLREKGIKPRNNKTYRLAQFPNYPNLEKKEIRLINVSS